MKLRSGLIALFCIVALVAGCGKKETDTPPKDSGKASQAQQEREEPGQTETKAQTTCPIMGGKINEKYFADHDGKRVYFCCAGCNAPFKKDPVKYIKMLEDEDVTLDKTPASGN